MEMCGQEPRADSVGVGFMREFAARFALNWHKDRMHVGCLASSAVMGVTVDRYLC